MILYMKNHKSTYRTIKWLSTTRKAELLGMLAQHSI